MERLKHHATLTRTADSQQDSEGSRLTAHPGPAGALRLENVQQLCWFYCCSSNSKTSKAVVPERPAALVPPAPGPRVGCNAMSEHTEIAILAAGCFWSADYRSETFWAAETQDQDYLQAPPHDKDQFGR